MRPQHYFLSALTRRGGSLEEGSDLFTMGAKMVRRFWQGEHAPVYVLVLAALLVRLYFLGNHEVISADGTSYAGVARALRSGDMGGLGSYGFYPALIWLVSFLVSDLELAGRLVSVIAGSLLPIPLYLLGKELFSRQTALIAAILALTWPILLGWSGEVMTQVTYTTLACTGVWLIWRLFRERSRTVAIAAGCCLGFTYLVRPEGFLLFFALPLVPLSSHCRVLKKWLPILIAYLVPFLACLLLNMVITRHVTGVWQLSAKTNAALNDSLAYYLNIPDLNYLPNYKPLGYLDIIREYPDFVGKTTLGNLEKIWNGMLTPLFWLLALTGFIAGGFGWERNASRLFLLSAFAPLLVIILFYYATAEYTLPYVPIMLLWIGEGLNRIGALAAGSMERFGGKGWQEWPGKIPIALLMAVTIAIIPVTRQIMADLAPPVPMDATSAKAGHLHQKHIGLMLRENLPPGKLMTRWARIAFYADREWLGVPKASIEEIVGTAREHGVRYLVVDEALADLRPSLQPLIEFVQVAVARETVTVYPDGPVNRQLGIRPSLIYLHPEYYGVAVFEVMR
jgi:4-amino-4-deoxy-L-arabinose transferase-like glycosyltransferase